MKLGCYQTDDPACSSYLRFLEEHFGQTYLPELICIALEVWRCGLRLNLLRGSNKFLLIRHILHFLGEIDDD